MTISIYVHLFVEFLPWRNIPSGRTPPRYRGFMITFKHTTLGKTPPHKCSARRRDLYPNKYSTHHKHPCPRRDSNPQSQQASGLRPTP